MPVTLVEFYDKSPLENVVSSLTFKPQKLVFLGSNIKLMERETERYRRLLGYKGIAIEVECRHIQRNDLGQIQETLLQIAGEHPRCAIDLTGGDELSLVAVGTVAQILKDKYITFHRTILNTRKAINFFNIDPQADVCEPTLSVAENIMLYGGSIVYESEKPGATYLWDWSEEFKNDINILWEIVRRNCGGWNTQLRQLEGVIKPGETSVFCRIGYKDMYGDPIRLWNKKLFYSLQAKKLISNFICNNETFSFTIKNAQISRVLSKAGTILELKTYLIAIGLQNKKQAYFNDVMTGVCIDWDGEIHQDGDSIRDTENEIDVLCMNGLRPLFISCKNGAVDETELYKLNTVAQRFGGEYAKKALVATYIEKKPKQLEYFRQRAQDMDIQLLEQVDTLDDKAFAKRLRMLLA